MSTPAFDFSARVDWQRVSRKRPCQICGKANWCEVSVDGQLAHCMRVPGERPMRWRGGGWVHELGGGCHQSGSSISGKVESGGNFGESDGVGSSATSVPYQTLPPKPEPLSPPELDQVFRALLRLCPLSTQHRVYLEGEGLPPEAIERCGSLQYAEAARVAKELVTQFGERLAARHPALLKVSSKDGKRAWWTLAGAADGLLFPAFNFDGLVTGIQLRKDQPFKPDERYRWLSHAGLGGTPLTLFPASLFHSSDSSDSSDFPDSLDSPDSFGKAEVYSGEGEMRQGVGGIDSAFHPELIITEGFKKAAVAAKHWQCHAISLAGVSAFRSYELVETIERLGISRITLAFDQDKRQKPQVQEAERRLLQLLAASFPVVKLNILEWDMSLGKGLDDALKVHAPFRLVSPDFDSGARLVRDLPPEVIARAFGAVTPLFSLKEAREKHFELLYRLVTNPDRSRSVVTSSTGTGKSRAADDAIAEALMQGRLKGRVLLLAPNKLNIAERTVPDTPLGRAVAFGLAAIQRGRRLIELHQLDLLERSPEDCANPEASAAGLARHAAAKVVCASCPFGSQRNWQERLHRQYPNADLDPLQFPRPFRCEVEGYLHSRLLSDKAQVVIATKEAFLNNGHKLAEFEVVICDEDLLPYLYESIPVGTEVLSVWRESMARHGISGPHWHRLFQVIDLALDTLSRVFLPEQPGRLFPALVSLRHAATDLGFDLNEILSACAQDEPGENETFGFEKPYLHNGKLALPFRAAVALLKALRDKSNPPLAVRNGDGSFSLEIFEVRGHLVEILRQRTVVILDATVPPALRTLFPDLKEVCFPVWQNLHITQITNALYSRQDLYNPQVRSKVSRTIEQFCRGVERPLAVVPLRFQEGAEALELPPEMQVEHWGLHKATSKFADCDSLVLVGHHLRPIDRIKAEVVAIRAWCGGNAPPRGVERKLRLYHHFEPEGKGAARWMKADADPEVQAAIEHDYASHVIQAIGRLRAALRGEELPPARVLLLCNEPVGDLRIDRLTSVKQLGIEAEQHYGREAQIDNISEGKDGEIRQNLTNPVKSEDSIQYIYMEKPEMRGLVTGFGLREELEREWWEETLLQDETVESQGWDAPWEKDLPQLRE